jgi:hypothetical protein
MKRHVPCFMEKAGFEPRTLGTKAERYNHSATRPVAIFLHLPYQYWRLASIPYRICALLLHSTSSACGLYIDESISR